VADVEGRSGGGEMWLGKRGNEEEGWVRAEEQECNGAPRGERVGDSHACDK